MYKLIHLYILQKRYGLDKIKYTQKIYEEFNGIFDNRNNYLTQRNQKQIR